MIARFKKGFAPLCSIMWLLVILSQQVAAETSENSEPQPVQANAAKGQKIFLQCTACHSADKGSGHKIGPNLWGVVGRPVASLQEFPYSDAIKKLEDSWSHELLDRFLSNPQQLVPETRMTFPGLKNSQDRADVIAFLYTLSDTAAFSPKAASGTVAYGGLPEGPGRDAVYFTCRACHSLKQFTQQKLERNQWDELLNTMVQKNGMEAPEPWVRTLILNYLATHFAAESDDWQGLPAGTGREEVFYICQTCHSLKMVTQQGLSRDSWDETLDWMVEEQGMDEPDRPTRELILNYLATHFGIQKK